MIFKNLHFFALPPSFTITDLEERLSENALKPVGALALSSAGFVPPLGGETTALTHEADGCIWFTVGIEERLLPSSVVNDHVEKRVRKAQEDTGAKVSGRARKQIKDQVITELLPKAFVKPKRINAYIDTRRNYVVVDTASRKAGETVLSEVRGALGSFPALPLSASVSVPSVLSGWLAGEEMPEGVILGSECELKEGDGGETWRSSKADLHAEEVAKHLEAGKLCTRLGVSIDERSHFTIGEDLVVRKFKADAAVLEQVGDHESAEAELDAYFVVLANEARTIHDFIDESMKLTPIE